MSIIPKKLAKYMIPKIGLGNDNWQAIDFSIEEFGSLFVILPISDAGKTPAKSYPKLQERFASYNPDVFQTQQDIDDLVRMIEEAEARIAKEKESQN